MWKFSSDWNAVVNGKIDSYLFQWAVTIKKYTQNSTNKISMIVIFSHEPDNSDKDSESINVPYLLLHIIIFIIL